MWVFCALFLGNVLALPTDEFRALVHEGDLGIDDGGWIKQIVPSAFSSQISNEDIDTSEILDVDDKDSENFKSFLGFVEKGVTQKGLIFNVYDDDMRNAAISLFRLLRETRLYNRIDYDKVIDWANNNVNDDMNDYVKRLTALYSNSYISEDTFLPPFLSKPNYFINGETIVKALYFKNNYGKVSSAVLNNLNIHKVTNNFITIDSNYSGWNIPLSGCDQQISYFKDDVALNSYYYGIQLLHPFWMSNEELDETNPNHAEHYYYAHQQLLARYRLEKQHLGVDTLKKSLKCESDYSPYLYYESGLAFPTRSSVIGELEEGLTYIKSVDIAMKECIHRGIVIMENGTFIKVTPDNYINLMTKLIRANLDGIKSAKVIRSIFGYGNNGYPVNIYNPTPSVLHHPQTTLRDPIYWVLIEKGLSYFSEYTNHTNYDLSEHETEEFNITEAQFSKITTVFEYSYINLQNALESGKLEYESNNVHIFARQRRLNHLPFTLNFTVESKTQKDVIVRLFLGPQCEVDECWNLHLRFFELDCYRYKLGEGLNIVSWSSKNSNRYSTYNEELYFTTKDNSNKDYNIYKFPKNLVIPKGLQEGLNLTMFIMITEDSGQNNTNFASMPSLYKKMTNKLDNKPLGFPFHMQVELSNDFVTNAAPNYKFFNLTVYHKKSPVDDKFGYFSPHLY